MSRGLAGGFDASLAGALAGPEFEDGGLTFGAGLRVFSRARTGAFGLLKSLDGGFRADLADAALTDSA